MIDRVRRSSLRASHFLAAAATAGVAGAAIAADSRHRAPRSPVLDRLEIARRRESRAKRPLRVGFATDTHIGPIIRAEDITRAMDLLAAGSPDLLLFGGDFICESPRYIPELGAALGEYASLGRVGAYAVLGNHDYANDAPRLVTELERRGIRVLRNESVAVGEGDREIWIAGIDDALLGRPDLDATFAAIPDNAAALSLWHEPDWAGLAADRGAFLQLSGHSHGGQVVLPLLGPAAAPSGGKRYISGINVVGGMPVYTSRGIGTYRPPVRFRCAPEVTLVEVY